MEITKTNCYPLCLCSFVSCLALLSGSQNILVSGGGVGAHVLFNFVNLSCIWSLFIGKVEYWIIMIAAHQEILSTLDLQFFWSQFLFEKFLLSLCHKCIIAIVSGLLIYHFMLHGPSNAQTYYSFRMELVFFNFYLYVLNFFMQGWDCYILESWFRQRYSFKKDRLLNRRHQRGKPWGSFLAL